MRCLILMSMLLPLTACMTERDRTVWQEFKTEISSDKAEIKKAAVEETPAAVEETPAAVEPQ